MEDPQVLFELDWLTVLVFVGIVAFWGMFGVAFVISTLFRYTIFWACLIAHLIIILILSLSLRYSSLPDPPKPDFITIELMKPIITSPTCEYVRVYREPPPPIALPPSHTVIKQPAAEVVKAEILTQPKNLLGNPINPRLEAHRNVAEIETTNITVNPYIRPDRDY